MQPVQKKTNNLTMRSEDNEFSKILKESYFGNEDGSEVSIFDLMRDRNENPSGYEPVDTTVDPGLYTQEMLLVEKQLKEQRLNNDVALMSQERQYLNQFHYNNSQAKDVWVIPEINSFDSTQIKQNEASLGDFYGLQQYEEMLDSEEEVLGNSICDIEDIDGFEELMESVESTFENNYSEEFSTPSSGIDINTEPSLIPMDIINLDPISNSMKKDTTGSIFNDLLDTAESLPDNNSIDPGFLELLKSSFRSMGIGEIEEDSEEDPPEENIINFNPHNDDGEDKDVLMSDDEYRTINPEKEWSDDSVISTTSPEVIAENISMLRGSIDSVSNTITPTPIEDSGLFGTTESLSKTSVDLREEMLKRVYKIFGEELVRGIKNYPPTNIKTLLAYPTIGERDILQILVSNVNLSAIDNMNLKTYVISVLNNNLVDRNTTVINSKSEVRIGKEKNSEVESIRHSNTSKIRTVDAIISLVYYVDMRNYAGDSTHVYVLGPTGAMAKLEMRDRSFTDVSGSNYYDGIYSVVENSDGHNIPELLCKINPEVFSKYTVGIDNSIVVFDNEATIRRMISEYRLGNGGFKEGNFRKLYGKIVATSTVASLIRTTYIVTNDTKAKFYYVDDDDQFDPGNVRRLDNIIYQDSPQYKTLISNHFQFNDGLDPDSILKSEDIVILEGGSGKGDKSKNKAFLSRHSSSSVVIGGIRIFNNIDSAKHFVKEFNDITKRNLANLNRTKLDRGKDRFTNRIGEEVTDVADSLIGTTGKTVKTLGATAILGLTAHKFLSGSDDAINVGAALGGGINRLINISDYGTSAFSLGSMPLGEVTKWGTTFFAEDTLACALLNGAGTVAIAVSVLGLTGLGGKYLADGIDFVADKMPIEILAKFLKLVSGIIRWISHWILELMGRGVNALKAVFGYLAYKSKEYILKAVRKMQKLADKIWERAEVVAAKAERRAAA